MNNHVWTASRRTLLPCVILAGCVVNPAQRHIGIEPILNAARVEESSGRVARVMDALSADAGGGSLYEVTVAGFNYVDDRCTEYFSELFYLNRRREAVKSGLTAVSQTTNAILIATGASSLSMAVVAQAFGLASSLTEIVAGTYLYQLPPATTQSFVKKLQGAFREGVYAKRNEVNSPTVAYHLIQDYLSLCLPPVIEAKLVEHVADAKASPVRTNSAANIEIRVASERVDPARREVVTVIREVRQPVERPKPPVSEQPGAVGAFEPRLTRARVARFQKTLCISPATGVIDDATRAAIDEFFRGVADGGAVSVPSAKARGVQAVHTDKLDEAEDLLPGGCDPGVNINAFEVGRLVS